ncbi:MAG: aspartate--tRNA(Asn) ligase [Clostridiales bacterium]|jgi:aspartyl-tRNA synthetase|nr:aspartate--tRNA(Asn) ligase [Clostridiales bacterium]
MRTYINQLKSMHGQTVTLCGFVHEVRDLKKMQFVVLKDVSGECQLTLTKTPENCAINSIVSSLTIQSSIKVIGKVNVDDFVKMGGVEVLPTDILVVSIASAPLPIDMTGLTESGKDTRADWRFLDLRDKRRQLIFKVQTTMLHAMRQFWIDKNFLEIFSPKLVATPSEGGAELFELDYFGDRAYLAQSPQVYKQMAIAAGFDRVFEIGPAFRADKSHTNRHTTEFTSVDIEMAWIDSIEDIMSLQEQWITHFITVVIEKHFEQIKEIMGFELQVPKLPFARISMKKAKDIVKELGYSVPKETKGDLDPQAERLIGSFMKDKYQSDFVFVTDYPTSIRPFYHHHKEDCKTTNSFDLLYKGIEISTGAKREHNFDKLIMQAVEKGVLDGKVRKLDGSLDLNLMPKGMDSYFNCFKYGCPPHGGFGFGLSRMLMQLLRLDNVREASYIYRSVDRLTP